MLMNALKIMSMKIVCHAHHKLQMCTLMVLVAKQFAYLFHWMFKLFYALTPGQGFQTALTVRLPCSWAKWHLCTWQQSLLNSCKLVQSCWYVICMDMSHVMLLQLHWGCSQSLSFWGTHTGGVLSCLACITGTSPSACHTLCHTIP